MEPRFEATSGRVFSLLLSRVSGISLLMGENPRPPFAAVHFFHFWASFVLMLFAVILMLCQMLAAFLEATTRGRCGAEAARLPPAGLFCPQEAGLDFLVPSAWPSSWRPFWVHNGLLMVTGRLCERYQQRTAF